MLLSMESLKSKFIYYIGNKDTRVAILSVWLLITKIILEEKGIEVWQTLNNILVLGSWYAVVKLGILFSSEKINKWKKSGS